MPGCGRCSLMIGPSDSSSGDLLLSFSSLVLLSWGGFMEPISSGDVSLDSQVKADLLRDAAAAPSIHCGT